MGENIGKLMANRQSFLPQIYGYIRISFVVYSLKFFPPNNLIGKLILPMFSHATVFCYTVIIELTLTHSDVHPTESPTIKRPLNMSSLNVGLSVNLTVTTISSHPTV